jgi:hypothetical protein
MIPFGRDIKSVQKTNFGNLSDVYKVFAASQKKQ